MSGIYKTYALELLASCGEYRRGELDLAALKDLIWAAASQLAAPSDRELRDFLQNAEGRLDMIQFTVDAPGRSGALLDVVVGIEDRLSSYVDGADADGE